MIVENMRNGKRIRCLRAFSALPQARGLMFRRKPVGILFDFKREGFHPIHSFFVFFPFYALYLDGGGRVLEKELIAPFIPFHKNSRPARYLLELGQEDGQFFSIGDEVCFDAGMEDN